MPTTRPYIEYHIAPAYESAILLKRFGQASSDLVRWIYQQLNYSAAAVVFAQESLEDFERAIGCLEDIEQGYYLGRWSWIVSRLGNTLRVLACLETAVEIAQGVDNKLEVVSLHTMAGVYSSIGQTKEALRLYKEALLILREVGDRAGEGATLYNMANLSQQLEHYRESEDLYYQSLLFFQQVSHVAGEIAVLMGLACVHFEHHNRSADAISYLEQAIMLFQTTALPQDAAGNTLEEVQQILERVRNGSSFFSQAEDTDQTALIQALSDFINADTWETYQQILETQQVLLFQPEGETILEQSIQQAKDTNNESSVQIFEFHLTILRACKREGIAPTFAQLLQAQTTTTAPPLPFDAELLQKSIAALLGSPQEKMQHIQYLATVDAATTDEQLKALLNTIQLALFGGDLSHLGQDLQGAYQQGWQTSLNPMHPFPFKIPKSHQKRASSSSPSSQKWRASNWTFLTSLASTSLSVLPPSLPSCLP